MKIFSALSIFLISTTLTIVSSRMSSSGSMVVSAASISKHDMREAIQRVADDVTAFARIDQKSARRAGDAVKSYNTLITASKYLFEKFKGNASVKVMKDFPGNPVETDLDSYVVAVTVSVGGEPMTIYFQYVGDRLCCFIDHKNGAFFRFADNNNELMMRHLAAILNHKNAHYLALLLRKAMGKSRGKIAYEAIEMAFNGAKHRSATVLYDPCLKWANVQGIMVKGINWTIGLSRHDENVSLYVYSDPDHYDADTYRLNATPYYEHTD